MKKQSALDLFMLLVFAFCTGTALRNIEAGNWYPFAFSTIGAMIVISYAAIRIVNAKDARAITRR